MRVKIIESFSAVKLLQTTIRPKKSCLVFGNQSGEDFFYHSPTRITVCVSEYIFLIKKKNKKTKQEDKKKKKSKRN